MSSISKSHALAALGFVLASVGVVLVGVVAVVYSAAQVIVWATGVSELTAVIIVLVGLAVLSVVFGDEKGLFDDGPNWSGNPPPEISPTKKMDLLMPTEYPIKRDTRPWPDFFGHKFPLGGPR